MKLISWNVNGLRSCLGKGFGTFFESQQADVFCIQETKMQQGQTDYPFEGYHAYWNSAVKKGYSGTAVFSKEEPLSVRYNMGNPAHEGEGRMITLEYPQFFLVNVYTPNSQRGLTRLDYRMEWEDAFLQYVMNLDKEKPVVICGDMNVAHQEIDLKNPKTNRKNAGFTQEERDKMTRLLESGWIDTYRFFYPDTQGVYSWWSYMYHARENNAGWRIDYFLASQRLEPYLKGASIHTQVMGSDHCPVELELEF
ncbi:MAG: exodeoxyribonuclease III [Massiliimalia sp.]|jgi:exodeoxyribonuclease-3